MEKLTKNLFVKFILLLFVLPFYNLSAQEYKFRLTPDTTFFEIGRTDTIRPKIENLSNQHLFITQVGYGTYYLELKSKDIKIITNSLFLDPTGYDASKGEFIILFTPTRNYEDFSLFFDVYPNGEYNPDFSTILVFKKQPTSVNDDKDNIFCFFPNPARDFIEINFNNEASRIASYKVEIYNTLGIDVSPAGGGVNGVDGGGCIRIDVSHLPAGVYYIKIGDMVEKFVKL